MQINFRTTLLFRDLFQEQVLVAIAAWQILYLLLGQSRKISEIFNADQSKKRLRFYTDKLFLAPGFKLFKLSDLV